MSTEDASGPLFVGFLREIDRLSERRAREAPGFYPRVGPTAVPLGSSTRPGCDGRNWRDRRRARRSRSAAGAAASAGAGVGCQSTARVTRLAGDTPRFGHSAFSTQGAASERSERGASMSQPESTEMPPPQDELLTVETQTHRRTALVALRGELDLAPVSKI